MDTGSRATFTFNGTGAAWIAYLDEWSGIAKVYVDGVDKGTVDTYRSSQQAQSKQYTVSGLASGTHTLTIEVAGQRNAASGGLWVWVDAFEVISGGSTSGGSTSGGSTSGGSTSGRSSPVVRHPVVRHPAVQRLVVQRLVVQRPAVRHPAVRHPVAPPAERRPRRPRAPFASRTSGESLSTPEPGM